MKFTVSGKRVDELIDDEDDDRLGERIMMDRRLIKRLLVEIPKKLFVIVGFYVGGVVFYNHFLGWEILKSVYFITQTICTIGYGDVTPSTDMTRLFTVFYLLIGLSFVFSILQEVFAAIFAFADEKALSRWRQPIKESIGTVYYCRILWAIFGVVACILVGVLVFVYLEEMPIITALYVATYTVTTIGYGDVAFQHSTTRIFSIFYMVSSVVITAMSIGQLTSANLDFQAEMRKMEFLSKKLNPDLIKQFDKDGDGVGKYEFVIGVFVQLGVLDEVDVLTWEQKFKELDTDGNGTLDEEDLQRVVDEHNDRAGAVEASMNAVKEKTKLLPTLMSTSGSLRLPGSSDDPDGGSNSLRNIKFTFDDMIRGKGEGWRAASVKKSAAAHVPTVYAPSNKSPSDDLFDDWRNGGGLA